MTKNIRISLYSFVALLFWMVSGFFDKEELVQQEKKEDLFTVVAIESNAKLINPKLKLKSTSYSERRVEVKAKTSGEVVKIGGRQGSIINKDDVLCSLGIVELNRTEVKAPFSGYIEEIIKPGNYLDRGQVCAVIIELNPIIFISEVPEFNINNIQLNQDVEISLITGEKIYSTLSFVSKSASPSTKTFKVETEVKNPKNLIRDGITAEMTIFTKPVLAHKVSPSILLLDDRGEIGIRIIDENNIANFIKINIIEDSNEGLWVSGLPDSVNIIIQGQGFVENGQEVLVNFL